MKTQTIKIGIVIIAFAAIVTIGSCYDQQNERSGREHRDDLKSENGHDHSQTKEQDRVMENEVSHSVHESIQENFAHQEIIILEEPYRAEQGLSEELIAVINAYLEIKDALVNDDPSQADVAAYAMTQKVEAIDASLFRDDGKKAWDQHASLYKSKLEEMQHVQGLEEKRSYFSHISEVVYCTVKSFDLTDEIELFATFCPMAFDKKGAYWISETEEIKNPYFGASMLKCGKVQESL